MSSETPFSDPFSAGSKYWVDAWVAPFAKSPVPVAPTGAFNLLVPAFGATAAMTAVGVGAAAQAWGFWFGAMTGALETARSPLPSGRGMANLFGLDSQWDENEPETGALAGESSTPSSRALAAAKTMAVDLESAAHQIEDTGRKVTKALSDDIETALETAKKAARANPLCAPLLPKEKRNRPAVAANTEKPSQAAVSRKPAAIAKPAAVDDLRKITGIGPKLEMVLNDLGVYTYEQIAAWGPGEIAWIDDYLSFSGRIERDKWIEQAESLAKVRGAAITG